MQLQKSTLLEELQLTDSSDGSDAYMYKLSRDKGLEHFRFVVLVASRQDSYVPVHSAHIQHGRRLCVFSCGGCNIVLQNSKAS